MTPTEALEHQEKMEVARGEFALWWAEYCANDANIAHCEPAFMVSYISRTQHMHTAWEAWKAAKGLVR